MLALGVDLQEDGIIEIAGAGRVDGDGEFIQKALAACQIALIEAIDLLPRFFQNFGRKGIGNA